MVNPSRPAVENAKYGRIFGKTRFCQPCTWTTFRIGDVIWRALSRTMTELLSAREKITMRQEYKHSLSVNCELVGGFTISKWLSLL